MKTTRKGFLGSLAALIAAPVIKSKEQPKTFPTNSHLIPETKFNVSYFTSSSTGCFGWPMDDRDLEPLPILRSNGEEIRIVQKG